MGKRLNKILSMLGLDHSFEELFQIAKEETIVSEKEDFNKILHFIHMHFLNLNLSDDEQVDKAFENFKKDVRPLCRKTKEGQIEIYLEFLTYNKLQITVTMKSNKVYVFYAN